MLAEVVAGIVGSSLALLSDAGHMLTDAVGILIALSASLIAARPASPKRTFGYHRVEILAAIVNALVLLGLCVYLAYAGIRRLVDPVDVEAGQMLVFAAVGLAA
ncbi:MAG: cation diffusion facilitator family transporter, partial [Microvirga sp.]